MKTQKPSLILRFRPPDFPLPNFYNDMLEVAQRIEMIESMGEKHGRPLHRLQRLHFPVEGVPPQRICLIIRRVGSFSRRRKYRTTPVC